MHGDIAVIGDTESIKGFKAAGIRTVCIDKTAGVDSRAATAAAIEKLALEKCLVIFITEQALEGVEDIPDSYKDHSNIAIIPIPGRYGTTGAGMRILNKNVERALGANILGVTE